MKPHSASVLIVDDDEHVLLTSRMILKQYFQDVETLPSPKTLDGKAGQKDYDVIVLDMNFRAGATDGNEGIFWMNRLQSLWPNAQVVLQTAYGDIELAVRSIREGAVDFLPKPWDKEKLVTTVFNAWKLACAKKENRSLKSQQQALRRQLNRNDATFVAADPSMETVLRSIAQAAPTDAHILILGENGTGKELVARAVHEQSLRSGEAFITVDVAAIPASLFESEMFGHEKGAFTDAKELRIGKFELANNGTLFLDEIGNLAPELQVKLLSALQTRTITRIGSNKPIFVDVRVICATNAPVYELVKSGGFRQDLFYRINTVEIRLPPLRERKHDIPLLIRHFMNEYCRKYNKERAISETLMAYLSRYSWPGNIRELQHSIERAVILSNKPELSIDDFQLHTADDMQPSVPQSLRLVDVEREAIALALKKWNGNLTKASEDLGIGRSTLYRKMEEYGLGG